MQSARRLIFPFSKRLEAFINTSAEREKMFQGFTEKGEPGKKLRKILEKVMNTLTLPNDILKGEVGEILRF